MDLAFELMGLGLGGVFISLFVLFVAVNILVKLFPYKGEKEDSRAE